MMRQYLEIKSSYPDAILFFRLGDFYELFFEDAVTAAEALGRGETVGLLVGTSEAGDRVETILFELSGRGAQSTGSWVQAGLWNGAQLLTTKGHALDRDAYCFCRACEAANAVELPDEE